VILEYIISSFTFFVISIILFCIIHYGKPKAHNHLFLGSTANIFSNTLLKTILHIYSDILLKEGLCVFEIVEL